MTKTALLTCVAACIALAQIQAPVAGVVRNRAGELRPMLGVAGAFVAGEVIAREIVSAAFSGSLGLAKTEHELLTFNARQILERHEAPAGPAAFGFAPDGSPAWAWFSEAHEVWRWTKQGIRVERRDEEPEIDAQVRREGADLVVLETGARIEVPEGSVEQMSAGWIVIHANDGDHAVRITPGREMSARLPEAAQ